jgi:hypothetical protein
MKWAVSGVVVSLAWGTGQRIIDHSVPMKSMTIERTFGVNCAEVKTSTDSTLRKILGVGLDYLVVEAYDKQHFSAFEPVRRQIELFLNAKLEANALHQGGSAPWSQGATSIARLRAVWKDGMTRPVNLTLSSGLAGVHFRNHAGCEYWAIVPWRDGSYSEVDVPR